MKKITASLLCAILIVASFSSCRKLSEKQNENNIDTVLGEDSSKVAQNNEYTFIETSSDAFTDRDGKSEYDKNNSIMIELNGNSATASDESVKISGRTVTISADKTHVISGQLDDGMIIVDAPETAKLQLVFDTVTITSKTSAALYIKEADKVFVTLVGESTLENSGSFDPIDENNIDGAIFSKQDLTFNGTGTLNVNSPSGHGIVGKDDVVFTEGVYNISASSHAIDVNDSMRSKNAVFTMISGKDGIHVENTEDATKGFVYIESGVFNIDCQGDGISSSSYMQIENGSIDILSGGGYQNGTKASSGNWGNFGGGFGGGMFGGGGKPGGDKRPGGRSAEQASSASVADESSTSMKGLKSDGDLLIESGVFTIDSADDAVHSNTSATINGGTFEIASGDDAFHAEENLTISNGIINITNSYEGLEALHVTVSGGNVTLKSSDDGINAAGGTDRSGGGGRDQMFGGGFGGFGGNSNGSITISGGTLYINASGDGIDANGTLEITGGHTTVCGPTSGDTAVLDYDKTATIAGGTFLGTGSSMMAQSISSSTQGVIALSVGNQSAGSEIKISDEKGNIILSYSPALSYQIFIFSSPELVSGESYDISVGSAQGNFEAE